MSLPTNQTTLMFSKNGRPWCCITTSQFVLANTLYFSKDGRPWWGYGATVPTPVITGNIKAILKVTTPYINRFLGVDMTHVEG